ncbi:MAG: hydantoinase B/oxoprolinase family protein, partial [Firmicutes bacterium]|nr:hydantoinase B/oxoprolinase family protein [Bacillota bacterium]
MLNQEYVNNPITTEIIRNAFLSAAEEMCESLFRSAYTPIIYEMKDCAVGLFNENLEVLGQSTGVPLFLGNLEETVRYAIDYYGGKEFFADGDVFILNDCYISGTHLNDMTVFAPIFYHGELVGFSANRAHWLDVGSKDPLAPMDAINIFQEGIRLGPLKIIEQGQERKDIIDTICMNSRFSRNARGDLNGQIAACRTGEKRLRTLIERFGTEAIRCATRAIFEQTAQLEREVLLNIPPGVYHAEGYLDNDGFTDDPVHVKVKMTISNDAKMEIDLTGSSPMCQGSTNCGFAQAISACRVAYKMLVLPLAPVTGGSFQGLSIIVPKASIFFAQEPAACSWYFSHLGLMIDLIIECLADVMPDLVAGAHYGDSMVCYLAGVDPKTGELYAHDEPTVGGWGGHAGGDGQDCLVNVSNGDFKNFPVEILERQFPILVERYAIRVDSEGPGKNRGGMGVIRSYRTLTEKTNIYLWFERTKMPAWGVRGGKSALGPSTIIYDDKGHIRSTKTKLNNYPISKNWLVDIMTGGGGGYGDPFERETFRVLED